MRFNRFILDYDNKLFDALFNRSYDLNTDDIVDFIELINRLDSHHEGCKDSLATRSNQVEFAEHLIYNTGDNELIMEWEEFNEEDKPMQYEEVNSTTRKKALYELKTSANHVHEHKNKIDSFIVALKNYFHDKYNTSVKVQYTYTNFMIDTSPKFKFTSKRIYEFCEEFECELDYVTNDGVYSFVFEDMNMRDVFPHL